MGLLFGKPFIEIVLNQTPKPFYWTNEAVSGTVILKTIKPVNITSLRICCIGEWYYFVATSEETGTSELIRRPFFKDTISLLPSNNSGLPSDIGKKLEAGIYEFPFSFKLPRDLPPSTSAISKRPPSLYYYLSVLSIQGFRQKEKQLTTFPIVIMPRVRPPRHLLPIDFHDQNRKDVYIRVQMRTGYIFNDRPELPLEIIIQNPQNERIKEVKVKFIQYCRLGSGGVAQSKLHDSVLPNIQDFDGDHLHDTFVVHLAGAPSQLIPSYSYQTPVDKKSPWKIEHNLELEFVLSGFFTNMTFKMPIFVANHH